MEQAKEWMRYLQQQGYLPEEVDLDRFFEALEDQQVIGRDEEGELQLTAVGERRIRRSAFEEIFSQLTRGGTGYHPIRSAGEGVRAPSRDPSPIDLVTISIRSIWCARSRIR